MLSPCSDHLLNQFLQKRGVRYVQNGEKRLLFRILKQYVYVFSSKKTTDKFSGLMLIVLLFLFGDGEPILYVHFLCSYVSESRVLFFSYDYVVGMFFSCILHLLRG